MPCTAPGRLHEELPFTRKCNDLFDQANMLYVA